MQKAMPTARPPDRCIKSALAKACKTESKHSALIRFPVQCQNDYRLNTTGFACLSKQNHWRGTHEMYGGEGGSFYLYVCAW